MRFFAVVIFLLHVFYSQAQTFGGFRPSTKWKEINTDTARIIFSPEAQWHARRIATIIHEAAQRNEFSLGNRVKKINTVLHSNTTLANGYVALAPFRSEYYLLPSSDIFEMGANPWQEELAVHEYRHVQQYSNFNRGLSKIGSIVFGEAGQSLFNALGVPNWFFEGDAVFVESVLTPQGRARIPNFFNGFNALFREGRDYSWMKLRNGSLRDYVPNHYNLGYMLVNYGYEKYGNNFWRNVTQHASAFRSIIYPLQGGIKKYAGVDFKAFRKEALDSYRHEISRKRTDSADRAVVTNYYFPQFISEDSLVYLKSSYRQIPAFYIRHNDVEQKLKLRNISNESWLSYRNGLVAYTAYNVNPRWNLQDYSDIYVLDVRSGDERRLTSGRKYFTPDISPSSSKMIAVFLNDSTESELHVLSMQGNVIKKISGINHSFFLHPRFIDEDRIVVCERLSNSTMTMSFIDLQSGRREELIPATKALLGYPFVQRGVVYFVSSVTGNDDLFSLRLSDKKVFQLTAGATGNYFPSVYNNKITWSKFTSNGLQLMQQELESIAPVQVNSAQWKRIPAPDKIAGDSVRNILEAPTRNFEPKDYEQGKHLFNFHSWQPYYADPEISLNLYSDNILSTFSNEVFYRYNRNETSHAAGLNTSYAALFPVLTAGVTYTFGRTQRTPTRTINFDELETRAGFYIPLNFSGGKMYKALSVGSDFVHNKLMPSPTFKDSFRVLSNNYLHHFVNWSEQLPRAVQQIYPKFGYAVSIAHRHLLGEKGFQYLGASRFYLPSVGNHAIVISASIQETDTSNLVFSNRFSNARGYTDYYFSRMWKVSANYHMPLFYPDWGFGNILYFLRLRSNVFYDFSKVYSKSKTNMWDLRSVGAEFFFDTKWWNELPLTFGFRLSHLLDADFSNKAAGKNVFQFIVPVDIIPSH